MDGFDASGPHAGAVFAHHAEIVLPDRSGRNRVYTDDSDVASRLRPHRGWNLRNRGFGIQFNRLFRF